MNSFALITYIKHVWSETLMNYFDHLGTEDYVTATFTSIECT